MAETATLGPSNAQTVLERTTGPTIRCTTRDAFRASRRRRLRECRHAQARKYRRRPRDRSPCANPFEHPPAGYPIRPLDLVHRISLPRTSPSRPPYDATPPIPEHQPRPVSFLPIRCFVGVGFLREQRQRISMNLCRHVRSHRSGGTEDATRSPCGLLVVWPFLLDSSKDREARPGRAPGRLRTLPRHPAVRVPLTGHRAAGTHLPTDQ